MILKNNRGIKYVLRIVCLFLVVIAFGSHFHSIQKLHTSIERDLADYIKPLPSRSVTLFNTSTLTDRLNWYATATRVNPIFSLEGEDLNQLSEMLSIAHASREAFVMLPSRTEEDILILNKVFYPEKFISTLPELETLRREVIKSPDESTVHQYHDMLTKSVDEYLFAIEHVQSMFEEVDKKNENEPIYQYPAGYTTLASAYNVFENLKRGGLLAKYEAELRFACFNNYDEHCIITKPAVTEAEVPWEENVTGPDVKDEVRQLVKATNKYHLDTIDTNKRLVEIELTDSECVPYNNASYLMIERDAGGMFTTKTPQLTNDMLFYRSDADMHPDFMSNREDTSLLLYPQPYFTLYMCPDSGVELARIYNVLQMNDFIKKNLFGVKFTQLSAASRLRDIESELLSQGDLLHEQLLIEFIRELGELIDTYGEQGLAEYADEETALAASSLVRQTILRSSVLTELMRELIRRDITATEQDYDMNPLALDTTLQRGFQTITFMMFNESFTPYRLPLMTFSDETNITARGLTHLYSGAIREEFSWNTIHNAAERYIENRYLLEHIPIKLEPIQF